MRAHHWCDVREAIVKEKREEEMLTLVDLDDQVVGSAPREVCHTGEGILHRAFSIFLFDSRGELLSQKRSSQKKLWPRFWSNSCCSHPQPGEDMEQAATRRLREELGIATPLRFLYKFHYQAGYGDHGAENELCWVFVGHSDAEVHADRSEVEEWRRVDVDEVDRLLSRPGEPFTPWFRLEWPVIRRDYWPEVEGRLLSPPESPGRRKESSPPSDPS